MPEKSKPHGVSNHMSSKRTKPSDDQSGVPAVEPEGIDVERWGNPDVLELVRNDRSIVIAKGAILFKEGDSADCMYIVKSGTLRIRSGSIVYEDAIAGGIVGEMAMVEDARSKGLGLNLGHAGFKPSLLENVKVADGYSTTQRLVRLSSRA